MMRNPTCRSKMIRVVRAEHGNGLSMPLVEEYLGMLDRGRWLRLSKSVFYFRSGADRPERWIGPGDTIEFVG